MMAFQSKPRAAVLGTLAACALLTAGANANAQEASATGKGIVGGALLGGEAVLITEVLLGVDSPWVLAGSALGGAAAGGFGGYYVEQNASTRVSFYMLLGGMALIIPATIAYVDAMDSRRQEMQFESDSQPVEGLDADPPGSGSDSFSRVVPAPAPRFHGLVGVSASELALNIPNVEVSPVYSPAEVHELGVTQQTQVLFPLLHGLF